MFKHYKSENNVVDTCCLKTVALVFLLLPFLLSLFAGEKTHYYYSFIIKTNV